MNERKNRADSVEDFQSYKVALRDRPESTNKEVAVNVDWVVTGKPRPNLLNQKFNEGLAEYPVIRLTANSLREIFNRSLFR